MSTTTTGDIDEDMAADSASIASDGQPQQKHGRSDDDGYTAVARKSKKPNEPKRQQQPESNVTKVEDCIVVIDNIPVDYQSSAKIATVILESFPNVRAKSGSPLARGGYRLTMQNKADADRLLNTDNWKSTAFGGSKVWVHPPASKGPLAKPGVPSERTIKQQRQVVSFSFPIDVPAEVLITDVQPLGIVEVVDLAKTTYGNVPKLLTCESIDKARLLCERGFNWHLLHVRCVPYRPKVRPTRCGKCQSFDHSTYFCTNKQQKCPTCAGPHRQGDPACTKVRRCANCNGPHSAAYGNCQCYKAARDKATDLLLAKTRRVPVEQVESERIARKGPTWADVAGNASPVATATNPAPSVARTEPQAPAPSLAVPQVSAVSVAALINEITVKVMAGVLEILKPLVPALASVDFRAIASALSSDVASGNGAGMEQAPNAT